MSRDPLPPDPEGINDERAAWALAAIRAFMDETGTDMCDAMADLLTDLMHLSDRDGHDVPGDEQLQDFEIALAKARQCYAEETMAIPEEEDANG